MIDLYPLRPTAFTKNLEIEGPTAAEQDTDMGKYSCSLRQEGYGLPPLSPVTFVNAVNYEQASSSRSLSKFLKHL